MGSQAGLWFAVALGVIAAVAARRWADVRGAPAVLAWLAVPILVPFAVSIGPIPIFDPRYTIPAAIAFFVGLALVTQRQLAGRLGVVAAVAVAAMLAAGTVDYHRNFVKDRWAEVVRLVESEALPGEIVLVDPRFQTMPYDYYANREDLDVRGLDQEPAVLGSQVWIIVVDVKPPEPSRLTRPGYVTTLPRTIPSDMFDIEVVRLERT